MLSCPPPFPLQKRSHSQEQSSFPSLGSFASLSQVDSHLTSSSSSKTRMGICSHLCALTALESKSPYKSWREMAEAFRCEQLLQARDDHPTVHRRRSTWTPHSPAPRSSSPSYYEANTMCTQCTSTLDYCHCSNAVLPVPPPAELIVILSPVPAGAPSRGSAVDYEMVRSGRSRHDQC